MYKIFFFITLLFSKTIYIAAAGNLHGVMEDLLKSYNKKAKVIYASSGKLSFQILNNAPYDIFLSADMKHPMFLYKNKIGLQKPKVYAKGKIVLLSLKKISLKDLIKLDQIAIANPKLAPYGKSAIEVFKNLHIYKKIKNKLVFAENVNRVITYILHSADAGIVSKSSLKLIKFKYFYQDINNSLYNPIKQGVLLINKNAKEFYNFLFTKKAKEIFRKWGYED